MTAGVINNYTQFHRKDSDYKENLKNLAYDMLYGDNYASGEENPYVATDLQLGIHPARLTNIQQVYEDDVIDGFSMVKILILTVRFTLTMKKWKQTLLITIR